MKNLHVLPKFSDRWCHLYLEHGRLEQDASSLMFFDEGGKTQIPIDNLGLLMLGPGTSVTNMAMKTLAENNCLVCWTSEEGLRIYAHNTGGTHHSWRLLRQAKLFCDETTRLQVIRRMYQKRIHEPLTEEVTIEQIRGMEGARVRKTYQEMSLKTGVPWHGRNYEQDQWDYSDPINRALSSANACLYGVCHAAILSAGYAPAIGFIHTGKMLSFVYDVADLYKTELTIPLAFNVVMESDQEVERRSRIACSFAFYEARLMERILPDIAEVLDARDDLGEMPGELEGRALSLADRAAVGRVPWESQRPSEGRIVANGPTEV
jgi:CRISPR-associated protein Cas1